MTAVAALLVPGRTLTQADVDALLPALGVAPWQARQARLDARDAAIRAALAHLAHLAPTNRAKALHRAWEACARGVVPVGALAPHVVDAVAYHGDRNPPTWEQIARIGREGRTPTVCA